MNQEYTERDGVRISVTEHSVARIEALFERCREGLERFLRFHLRGSPQEARELTQEAYTRLMELPEGTEVSNWEGLLFVTAKNLAHTTKKRRKHHQAAIPLLRMDFEDVPTLEASWVEQQEKAAVHRALEELPQRQRVVLMRRFEGHSYEEIARELGVAERTCRRDQELALIAIRFKVGLE